MNNNSNIIEFGIFLQEFQPIGGNSCPHNPKNNFHVDFT